MKISLISKPFSSATEELLCLSVFEGNPFESRVLAELDEALSNALSAAASAEQFVGSLGQTLRYGAHAPLACRWLLVVGLGSRDAFDLSHTLTYGTRAAAAAVRLRARSVGVSLPPLDPSALQRAVPLLVQGLILGSYSFQPHSSKNNRKSAIVEANLLSDKRAVSALSVSRGELTAKAICMARDIVNESCSTMTPRRLAEECRELSKNPSIECRLLGAKECEKLGMHLFLSACSSDEEPRLIHLTVHPKGKERPTRLYALVGGGITRSAQRNATAATARAGKAGAAAVIGAISALPSLGMKAEVHGIIAAGETTEGSDFPRPGDILRGLAGKSVEIVSEPNGPLLALADALSYAAKVNVDEIIDLAAAGSASIHALGPHTATIVGTDSALVERYLGAARRVGEEVWHLPLPRAMRPSLRSALADVRHPTPGEGAAVTPGLFLREFCNSIPWAHVDVAGTATYPPLCDIELDGMATGFGVASLLDLLIAREGLS